MLWYYILFVASYRDEISSIFYDERWKSESKKKKRSSFSWDSLSSINHFPSFRVTNWLENHDKEREDRYDISFRIKGLADF